MADEPLEKVIRALIRQALDDCPAIIPQDRRYADDGGQHIAKELVSDRLVRALASAGVLPPIQKPTDANYHAVRYTMQRMRNRLLRHIKGGGRDVQAEAAAMQAITFAFFADLEEQGWRLMRTFSPRAQNDQLNPPGFKGRA